MAKKWIQEAGVKSGALSRQLGIPEEQNIPFTLLEDIVGAEPGDVVVNPTKVGNRRIHVTALLKKRANFALNVKRIKR